MKRAAENQLTKDDYDNYGDGDDDVQVCTCFCVNVMSGTELTIPRR